MEADEKRGRHHKEAGGAAMAQRLVAMERKRQRRIPVAQVMPSGAHRNQGGARHEAGQLRLQEEEMRQVFAEQEHEEAILPLGKAWEHARNQRIRQERAGKAASRRSRLESVEKLRFS